MLKPVAAALIIIGSFVWGPAHAADFDTAVNPGSLSSKLIIGYQGWFSCPNDLSNRGWFHWSASNGPTVDLLPEVTEIPIAERCHTTMHDANGNQVDVFTSQNEGTVGRHFAWMEQYALDGVALQRFASELRTPLSLAAVDQVLANVRHAAEAHGRVFFLMYDLSGLRPEDYPILIQDWARLEAQGVTSSPAYLHHRGHPLLGLWGIGFTQRPMTPQDARTLLAGIDTASSAAGGVTILGGVPAGWRTGAGDADPSPEWKNVWPRLGVISPWTVGRYANQSGADLYRSGTLVPDMAAAKAMGVDYMPVVFPGFSWANLMRARGAADKAIPNQIPRDCGRFYWRQVWNAESAEATMIYNAMFDEVDEGTAMFKITPSSKDVPADAAGRPAFVALDADGCHLPSDWYLRLAGAATRALHSGQVPSPALPLPLPDD
jgi:hypothetical protein